VEHPPDLGMLVAKEGAANGSRRTLAEGGARVYNTGKKKISVPSDKYEISEISVQI